MARRVKDRNLESRDARLKLNARGRPYYRVIERGVHLGYRRLQGGSGTWVVRRYIGEDSYRIERLATADDLSDSDGHTILDYWQAVEAVRDQSKKKIQKAAAPLTVKQAMADYVSLLESRGQSAAEAKYKINTHINPALGNLQVDKLTRKTIREWLADVAKKPARLRTKKGAQQRFRPASNDEETVRRRQSTANRVLTTLKAGLNHAYDEERVHSNDAWGRRVKPFRGADAARVRYLEIAEAKRLANAVALRFRPMVLGALQTGARYSELARVKVEDFNSDSGTLAIRKSKAKKTRHIVLTDEGVKYFKQVCLAKSGNDFIFPRPDGASWRQSEQLRFMNEACKNAKIEPPIGFHGLRHTWASQAVMNGVPLLVVAKNLGHSDTRMVEKHYGHLAPSYVADAIRAGAPRFGFKLDSKLTSIGGARS